MARPSALPDNLQGLHRITGTTSPSMSVLSDTPSFFFRTAVRCCSRPAVQPSSISDAKRVLAGRWKVEGASNESHFVRLLLAVIGGVPGWWTGPLNCGFAGIVDQSHSPNRRGPS